VNRKFHLTSAKDFARVKQNGKVIHHELVVMAYGQNDMDISRATAVASKKIGNAVIRNRVKRRIRACLNDNWLDVKSGWDFIFYSRSKIVDADYQEIDNAIKHLLIKAGVIKRK
jgi:ribonuclease P protein component